MNGPTVTYMFLKTMNAISDGIMIAVILLVSLLVVVIAFMSIRFTLLAKIEDDYREIGVMKAIGLRLSASRRFILRNTWRCGGRFYSWVCSFVLFQGMLLENIRLFMGESENSSLPLSFRNNRHTACIPGNRCLCKLRSATLSEISAAEAIRFGTSQEKKLLLKVLPERKQTV